MRVAPYERQTHTGFYLPLKAKSLELLQELKMKNWLDEIKWDADGLVPAIAQDHKTGRVLMMAWMNREALELTAAENRAIYWLSLIHI